MTTPMTSALVSMPKKPEGAKNRLRRAIVAFLIFMHFLFTLLVVTHVHEMLALRDALKPLVWLGDRYSQVTFSNRNFGFFAPSVSPDWSIKILGTSETGELKAISLPTQAREMEIKCYSMIGHSTENDDTMDLFARSWAVYLMNKDRTLIKIDIAIYRNFIPSMSEYRKGMRINSDHLMYKTSFEY